MSSSRRTRPNVLVTGTPGTGKTTTADKAAALSRTTHLDLNKLVSDKKLHAEYDAERECHVLDEDRILDVLEPALDEGGVIVDYHGADFFPERWFDLIFVLRTDNEVLYPRLQRRGYPQQKITENVEAEIMQVIPAEVRGAYDEEIIVELRSNSVEELDANAQRIAQMMARIESEKYAP